MFRFKVISGKGNHITLLPLVIKRCANWSVTLKAEKTHGAAVEYSANFED
jgi:hypothetical protein